MPRKKSTLVLTYGGQAYKLTKEAQVKFLTQMALDSEKADWTDFVEHLGETKEIETNEDLLALIAGQ